MTTQQITVLEAISAEIAAALMAQALAAGLSIEEYLKKLLGLANGAPLTVNVSEFLAAMDDFSEDVPPLPRDFSREDIYFPE